MPKIEIEKTIKIKCDLKDENCRKCPFRNESEYGMMCNLRKEFWKKNLIIKIIGYKIG